MKLEKLKQDGTIQKCAVVILAAGQSKRLGHPKQLVVYNGETLLNRAIDSAVETKIENIFVVLGAHFEDIKESISNKSISILINKNFEEGMASSIRCGLNEIISASPQIECVILMVCDQTYVSSDLILNLLSEHKKSDKPIIASQYENILGTPALFHKSFFEELLQITGDVGAGKIIKQNLSQVAIVPFEKGIVDIDTFEDLSKI